MNSKVALPCALDTVTPNVSPTGAPGNSTLTYQCPSAPAVVDPEPYGDVTDTTVPGSAVPWYSS